MKSKRKNYLTWISNLGVVPLVLFWVFLFLPIFTLLFERLLRVTLVFETISSSICLAVYRVKLTDFRHLVKMIALFALSPIMMNSYASQHQTLYLGVGEVIEYPHKNITRYTIGNSEVLKVKPSNNGNTLLLKATALGASDLLIWAQRQKKPHKIQIFVISKKKKIKLEYLQNGIKSLGLEMGHQASQYIVTGTLKRSDYYKSFVNFIEQSDLSWDFSQLSLTNTLKRDLLSEFYTITLNSYLDELNCDFVAIILHCYYDTSNPIPKKSKEHLEKKFLVSFIPREIHHARYFRVRLNLMQMESENGEEFHLGLDKLQGDLLQVFNEGLSALVTTNQVLLNNKNIELSTIAEPKTLIRFNHPAKIKIGAELPYSSITKEGVTNTQWKFAGLRINLEISPKGEKVLLKYSTEFSRPATEGSISGSSESSSSFIVPGKAIKLFEIGYQNTGIINSQTPVISKIPILGKLFSSNSKKYHYKKVSAILILDEVYE